VKLSENTLGPDHPSLVKALTNLGEVYSETGQYGEAEPLLLRALGIAENSWGIGPADLGAILNNLGKLYANQGLYQDAERFYLRALKLEETIGQAHPFVATWLNNLSVLYVKQGRYTEAWPLLERSMVLLPQRNSSDSAVAEAFSGMGLLFMEDGQYEDAGRLLNWSLQINNRAFGPDHPVVANNVHNLGMLHQRLGDYKRAEELLLRALKIREMSLPPDHHDLGTSFGELGLHYYALGKIHQAKDYFDRSLKNLADRFGQYFNFMSEKDRMSFLDTVANIFPIYYSFCLTNYDLDPSLAERMYDLLLWQKGLIAVSMGSLRSRIASEGNPECLKLFDQLQAKKTRLAFIRRSGTKNTAVANYAAMIERKANDLERRLVRSSAVIGRRMQFSRVSWRQVRQALTEHEAAVEYIGFDFHNGKTWTGETHYAALLLKFGGTRPILVPLGNTTKLLGAPLNDYRKQAGLERDPTLPDEPGFYDAFWKPLETALGDARRVYVSPEGTLSQIAWSVVRVNNRQRLVKMINFELVSSTRDLVNRRSTIADRTAVLVGNPDFDDRKQGEKASEKRAAHFKPLPATEDEIRAVNSLLEAARWNVKSYTGRSATEERVKAVHRPRVLHLATHGFFDSKAGEKLSPGRGKISGPDDPMLRSGLIFAGANVRTPSVVGGGSDGILTALEASALNLQGTELVVLSACETGLGQIMRGEGVFGLRRAFQEAGAEAVLMSMWSVPDEETQELMTLFYRNWLSGQRKHKALHNAQIELSERVKADWGKDRPELWGAFVLVGR
jgi:CHAT domain-containing protein/tetratricopeptide (TPR) repeat protein